MTEALEQYLLFANPGSQAVENTKRGKHYIQPRGYADRPGTGPAGETCGTCRFSHRVGHGRHPKCELTRAAWTHSRRTDILMRAPACRKWERKE